MNQNPYQSPNSDVAIEGRGDLIYAGFWVRIGAHIIDTILIIIITWPILFAVYGKGYFNSESIVAGPWDILISYVFPALAVILFWNYRAATPGKILLKIKIIDDKTGGKLTTGQCVGRYFAYIISILPLMLGIFWVAFDKKKQGWHDKLAGTVCIRDK
ncbi:MAG: RDD family protein [endosymbiont of Galathealinum brachiosum]|uniref:RDD family protein n=1 Tax=endosymbiont of Galathealinum brachiosum TaxID=2200906 RepID=A0A370DCX2_9GAMM|nr:MAG: RDD family protein [endosymbiont of Galathealinum brachiosum]